MHKYDPQERVVLNDIGQSVRLGYTLKSRLSRVAQREGLDATAAARRAVEAHVAAREREAGATDG